MTTRTPGRQPRGSRPAGGAGAAKRPTKRAQPTGSEAVTAVDGTSALKPAPQTTPVTPEDTAASATTTTPGTSPETVPGATHDAVPAPADVPPIDARVLLRALMTPPEGIDGGSLTDALTGAVPTWRLDEEPIYLEVVRDLGVPALDGSGGGTGEVIVGEVVGEVVDR